MRLSLGRGANIAKERDAALLLLLGTLCILASPSSYTFGQSFKDNHYSSLSLPVCSSYAPMAEVAVRALDFWTQAIPIAELKRHFGDILPSLETYFSTSTSSETSIVGESRTTARSKSATRWKAKEDSTARSVRLWVIDLLGRLGGEFNSALGDISAIGGASKCGEPSPWMAWDTVKRLP